MGAKTAETTIFRIHNKKDRMTNKQTDWAMQSIRCKYDMFLSVLLKLR